MVRQTHQVLVVDDNPANRKLLGVIVDEMGWSHVAADCGAAALRACAAQGPFDLILMDYRMPGLDGAETTAAIRAQDGWAAHIPVIGITADESQSARARCLAAGMLTCLSKPIQPLAVAALMRRVMEPAARETEQRRLAAG